MRLDLFLKASRLCSRRTIAQTICAAGRVSVNGNTAKSSHGVKEGDEITLTGRDQIIRVRVLSIPTIRQTSRKEAAMLCEILSEESVDAII